MRDLLGETYLRHGMVDPGSRQFFEILTLIRDAEEAGIPEDWEMLERAAQEEGLI